MTDLWSGMSQDETGPDQTLVSGTLDRDLSKVLTSPTGGAGGYATAHGAALRFLRGRAVFGERRRQLSCNKSSVFQMIDLGVVSPQFFVVHSVADNISIINGPADVVCLDRKLPPSGFV